MERFEFFDAIVVLLPEPEAEIAIDDHDDLGAKQDVEHPLHGHILFSRAFEVSEVLIGQYEGQEVVHGLDNHKQLEVAVRTVSWHPQDYGQNKTKEVCKAVELHLLHR